MEDEQIAMVVHSKMLEKLGYQRDVAEDGRKALSLAANEYDIILMDIGLPDISGIEVAAEIRKRENGSHHACIIGVTGYALEEVKTQCLDAGMDEVITKPMSIEKLSEIIEMVVRNRQGF